MPRVEHLHEEQVLVRDTARSARIIQTLGRVILLAKTGCGAPRLQTPEKENRTRQKMGGCKGCSKKLWFRGSSASKLG